MLETLRTTLKAIQAMLNKCVKKVNGITPDADGNVNIKVSWQEVTGRPNISEGTGIASIREGLKTTASGEASHAEGFYTEASGRCTHAEGEHTTASARASHAEGFYTEANGDYSHAEGYITKASGQHQHVQGLNNVEDAGGLYAHIVGNGFSSPSNAHTLSWDGYAWFAGGVYVGSTSGINRDEGSKKLVTADEVTAMIESAMLVDETEVV